ncbi:MAG TPA: lysophospholipid acyltransferase family protein [candidate division Zixibacteria bacterium]|nr:lysophospholipid acyltransferase family protein [candidate division Zixibacteria bacterium]
MKILYYTGKSLTWLIFKILFRIRIRGTENIPAEGPFILATNHLSYFDPPLSGSFFKREVYFMAKQELFKNKLFGGIIRRTNALPIRRGAVDRAALEMCLGVLERGEALTIFPEGTRSKGDKFLSAKPGIGMVAVRAGCPIVPAYIHGSNHLSACFFGRDRMSITYGKPITADEVAAYSADKQGYQALAEAVMERIGALKAERLELKQLPAKTD